MSASLLIVEDDARFAATLASEFGERGYAVVCVESLEQLQGIEPDGLDYAVVDLRLRRDSGLDAVEWLREHAPRARVVVLTGYASIATAVRAVKLGACDYLTKPVGFDELERALTQDAGETSAGSTVWQPPSLARHEREYIEFVLAECDGNISRAARRLGLHRQSLQRKLRKYTPP